MKLQRNKGEYLVSHGISKTYQDETVSLLKKCDAFSIGFDESEINKTSQLEVLVKLSDKTNGIQLQHYMSFDLYVATAEFIVNTMLDQFTSDGIDYKRKLIAPMSDGCNTMEQWCNQDFHQGGQMFQYFPKISVFQTPIESPTIRIVI